MHAIAAANMTDLKPESSAAVSDANPFEAPKNLNEKPGKALHWTTPSGRSFLLSLLIGNLLLVGSYLSLCSDRSVPLVEKSISLTSLLMQGGMYGLGMSLLAHAVGQRRLQVLTPGHWWPIASTLSILTGVLVRMTVPFEGVLVEPLPLLPAACFLMIVIVRVHETKLWKTYAWLCLVSLILGTAVSVIPEPSTPDFLPRDWRVVDRTNNARFVIVVLRGVVWLVSGVIVASSVWQDCRNRVSRDRFHYTGLVLSMLLGPFQMIFIIWPLLLTYEPI